MNAPTNILHLQRTSLDERKLLNGQRYEDLKEELAHDMRNAVYGRQGFVPYAVIPRDMLGVRKEHPLSASHAIGSALQREPVQDALRTVLADSRCLQVICLRQHLSTHLFRNIGDSLLDALDYELVAAALHKVLRGSGCHLVEALRAAIVAAYVEEAAPLVAEARGI